MSYRSSNGKKAQNWPDKYLGNAKESDVVIPIIGQTGAGKSEFINTLSKTQGCPVSDGMDLKTTALNYVIVDSPKKPTHRIIFLDTPGFNNNLMDDPEILRRIILWLRKSRARLGGVIYMHEISQTRTPGPALWKHMEYLSQQMHTGAGEYNGSVQGIVLATTKWSEVPKEAGERREKLLLENDWNNMITMGAETIRYDGTYKSAWTVVDLILDRVQKKRTVEGDLREIERLIARIRANI